MCENAVNKNSDEGVGNAVGSRGEKDCETFSAIMEKA